MRAALAGLSALLALAPAAAGASHAACAQAAFTGGALRAGGYLQSQGASQFIDRTAPASPDSVRVGASLAADGFSLWLSVAAAIERSPNQTTVRVTGGASLYLLPGATGSGAVSGGSGGPDRAPEPLLLSLPREAIFAIDDDGSGRVTFTPHSGQIVGNRLRPGTYLITVRMDLAHDQPSPCPGEYIADAWLGWTLTLTDPLACPADFDGSGGEPSVSDLFAYLAAYFAGDPRADGDASGGDPSVDDLLAYLAAWFQGCS